MGRGAYQRPSVLTRALAVADTTGVGEPSSQPRARGLREAALAIATLALCVGAAEATLRSLSRGSDFAVWQPGLAFTFHPDSALMPGIEGASRFSINASGIRGDAFSESQSYRILALGGSTTEGLYLDDNETWAYGLQQRLNEGRQTPDVWVGNVGKSGRNTRHHVFQLRQQLAQIGRAHV